jgi:DNA-binding response OmpR family regulator
MVLLVEDEALIRLDLEDALRDAGFEVVSAANGQAALRILEADPRQVHAVASDIRLGRGPDGWDVAKRARELDPAMPVIYISADSSHEWPSKGVPNSVMVPKPFVPVQIITALATLLTEAALGRPGTPA